MEQRLSSSSPAGVRFPGTAVVAVAAIVAGVAIGGAKVFVDASSRPWQVGDFRPDRASPTSGPTGTVEVDETVHAFGTVGTGAKGSHAFTVRNVGAGPLQLTRGATSCTCTIAGFNGGTDDRISLPPGGATEVRLEWRGKGPGGPFRQQATILTDDPRRPQVVFVVEGAVVPTWKAVPEAIQLSRVSGAEGGESEVLVYTYGDRPPEVVSVAIDHELADRFTLATEPLPPPEVATEPGATGGLRLTVTLPSGLPLGRLRATIRMVVKAPDELMIEIPVDGTVAGDLLVAGAGWDRTRQSLMLGTVSAQKGVRTELFITARGPHRERFHPKVRSVVPDGLEVTIGDAAPVGSGGVVRVPVTIVIPAGSRPVNHLCTDQAKPGSIVLDTGHPDTPELTIPVCVAIGP